MNILEELSVDTEKLGKYLIEYAKAYTGKSPAVSLKIRDQMAMAQFYVQLMILDKLDKIEQLLT